MKCMPDLSSAFTGFALRKKISIILRNTIHLTIQLKNFNTYNTELKHLRKIIRLKSLKFLLKEFKIPMPMKIKRGMAYTNCPASISMSS